MRNGLLVFFLVVSVSTLLMACVKENEDSAADIFKESQKIEVISPDGEVIVSISTDYNIEDFVKALKIEDWESVGIPSEATKGNTFLMYQADTVKLGKISKQENHLNQIATMTTYKDVPYIEFKLKSFTFSFKVPKDVSEYLNGYK